MGALVQLFPDVRPRTPATSSRKASTRTFRRHVALLTDAAPLTSNEIKALCWTLNGVKASSVTDDQRRELRVLLNSRTERPITAEQSAFGLDWLRKHCFRLDGTPRKRCPLGDREQDIVRGFDQFTWVGVQNVASGGYHKHYVPVWRVHADDGRYFDYYVAAGGPGGAVEVTIV